MNLRTLVQVVVLLVVISYLATTFSLTAAVIVAIGYAIAHIVRASVAIGSNDQAQQE